MMIVSLWHLLAVLLIIWIWIAWPHKVRKYNRIMKEEFPYLIVGWNFGPFRPRLSVRRVDKQMFLEYADVNMNNIIYGLWKMELVSYLELGMWNCRLGSIRLHEIKTHGMGPND